MEQHETLIHYRLRNLNRCMSRQDTNSVRIVIQHIFDDHYQIAAYSGKLGDGFKPAKVSSKNELLTRLRLALPAFDETLLIAEETEGTCIVFAADMKLSDAQRSILGLERQE